MPQSPARSNFYANIKNDGSMSSGNCVKVLALSSSFLVDRVFGWIETKLGSISAILPMGTGVIIWSTKFYQEHFHYCKPMIIIIYFDFLPYFVPGNSLNVN